MPRGRKPDTSHPKSVASREEDVSGTSNKPPPTTPTTPVRTGVQKSRDAPVDIVTITHDSPPSTEPRVLATANRLNSPSKGLGADRAGSIPGTDTPRNIVTETRHSHETKPAPSDKSFIPNILIFGETGTGKSSVVNMIASSNIAGVSGDALGCTFGSKSYVVYLNGRQVRLWDTAGLNEGEQGTVPAERAMQNLQDLVGGLSEGVNLLVYCIRGTRFRDILKINYDLFWGVICQRKVPIVIAVTGLENESPMESWWTENEKDFTNHGMSFEGHACITATRGKQMKSGEHMYEEEFMESKKVVQQLIQGHCTGNPLIMDKNIWMSDIASGLIRYYNTYGTADSGGTESNQHPPTSHSSSPSLIVVLVTFLADCVKSLVRGPGQTYLDGGRRPSSGAGRNNRGNGRM